VPVIDDLFRKMSDIEALIGGLRDSLQIVPAQVVIVQGLSELSSSLGLIKAGEFRSGNALQPGEGFTGVRVLYPPVTIGGRSYNIAGMDADTLMFGLGATDGTAYAGGGAVVLDALGLSANDTANLNAFRVFAIDQTYNSESVGAGDVLIGDNSTGKTNMFWDASAGELQIRRDATVVNRVASGAALSLLGCRTYKTIAQAIPIFGADSDWTSITFDEDDYDDAAFHDTAANTERLTIPAGMGGRYTVSAFASFDSATAGARSFRILKNGSTTQANIVAYQTEIFDAGTGGGPQTLSAAGINLAAADYVVFQGAQTAASTLDINISEAYATFTIQRVS